MGIRVIKTAIATVVAVYIAAFLQLNSPFSAGLLAILGVEVTRRKGLRSAVVRISASILGLFIASFTFWLFGFHIWVLAIFILSVYPLLNRFNLREGIITSSVIMFRVFSQESVNIDIITNEIQLLIIGLGTATAINFIYMPGTEDKLMQTREKVDQLFSQIFIEISRHLQEISYIWDGKEVIQAHDNIHKGINLADKMKENNLFAEETYWPTYFQMRKRQLESIQRMMGLVAQVYQTLPHNQITAELFEKLSCDVKLEYYTGNVEAHLTRLEREFKTMPLPTSREEFEVRSALLQLILELKHYLAIAKKEQITLSP